MSYTIDRQCVEHKGPCEALAVTNGEQFSEFLGSYWDFAVCRGAKVEIGTAIGEDDVPIAVLVQFVGDKMPYAFDAPATMAAISIMDDWVANEGAPDDHPLAVLCMTMKEVGPHLPGFVNNATRH